MESRDFIIKQAISNCKKIFEKFDFSDLERVHRNPFRMKLERDCTFGIPFPFEPITVLLFLLTKPIFPRSSPKVRISWPAFCCRNRLICVSKFETIHTFQPISGLLFSEECSIWNVFQFRCSDWNRFRLKCFFFFLDIRVVAPFCLIAYLEECARMLEWRLSWATSGYKRGIGYPALREMLTLPFNRISITFKYAQLKILTLIQGRC